MRAILLAVFLLAQGARLYAAESSSAQFLNLGFGARALGMGEAFTAVADDVSALYYNPAGLAGEAGGRTEMAFSHAWHVQDTSISQVGLVRRPYAYAVTYFSAGQLEGRNDLGVANGNFTANDAALAASRGFTLGPLQAGVSGRFISQRIKSSGATSLAADLGVLYRFEGTPYSAGAALVNLGTKVTFKDESYPLPMKLRAGAAAAFKAQKLLLALDTEFPNDAPALLRLGAEYRGIEPLAFRLGYRTTTGRQSDAILGSGFGDSSSGVSGMYGFFAGFGFKYADFNLDYALLPYGDLGSAHRFSLGVSF
ncbi:MAG TPA: PorV/PorQ family protein [Elusimicrobiales bacterium]|nr:PorV/PorQ family protein [Elusimicrobiales bacterium]